MSGHRPSHSLRCGGDGSGMVITLWRATDGRAPRLGQRTYWATSKDDALVYTHTRGLGGDALYRLDLQVTDTEVLDLRGDVWGLLHAHFHIDRQAYEDLHDHEHDAPAELAEMINASGYKWVRLLEQNPPHKEIWCFVGVGE